MMQHYAIHPRDPQLRLLEQVASRLLDGEIMVYPTDTTYALGCLLGNKQGMDRIRQIRSLDQAHDFSLICADLSNLSIYAEVDNKAFRLIKHHIPGPYTFILPATKAVPKAYVQAKKATIGLRVPNSPLLAALLSITGQPLVSVTLPLTDPELIKEQMAKQVDLFVDSGAGGDIPSSIIDLTGNSPVVLREGMGDVSAFKS
jgi:tRNA threonylcarbamoyl adenosine modification protein (Sua5/YciO/YrdC/YwlC family)